MTQRQTQLVEAVMLEIWWLRGKLGCRITPKALAFPQQNPAFIERAVDAGLKITEVADLVVCVAV